MELKEINRSILEEMDKPQLIELILELIPNITTLSDKVSVFESTINPKKNSCNASIPPSTDLTRPRKSKRRGKRGPSEGHKGISRRIKEKPDFVMEIPLKSCPNTGVPVQSNSFSYRRHQIIELEPAKILVIEIRRQMTTGKDGKTIVAPHPEGIKPYKRIGPNLKANICYMRFRLNIPWNRILEWLKEVIGESIAYGTLQSIFQELKSELDDEYQTLKNDIKQSEIVGGDETGYHVNGKKWWVSVFRTDDTTIYSASPNRNHQAAQAVIGEDFAGILLTDFWGAYNERFFPNAKGFQKCIGSHGLRDILYAIECEKEKGSYAKKLLEVILDAVYLKKFFIFDTDEYKLERSQIESRLDELLSEDTNTVTKEGSKLFKRLRKYRQGILLFLYYEKLAPDNNRSEQDIREIVMTRKISGSYRTEKGIQSLVVVKSIIGTRIKRKEDFVQHIKEAFGSLAWNTT